MNVLSEQITDLASGFDDRVAQIQSGELNLLPEETVSQLIWIEKAESDEQKKKKQKTPIRFVERREGIFFFYSEILEDDIPGGGIKMRMPIESVMVKKLLPVVTIQIPQFDDEANDNQIFNGLLTFLQARLISSILMTLFLNRAFGDKSKTFYNVLYPPLTPTFQVTIRYVRGKQILSSTSQITFSSMASLHKELYPKWEKFQADPSTHSLPFPLTAVQFEKKKDEIVNFFTIFISNALVTIMEKDKKYDENIDPLDGVVNIISIIFSFGRV